MVVLYSTELYSTLASIQARGQRARTLRFSHLSGSMALGGRYGKLNDDAKRVDEAEFANILPRLLNFLVLCSTENARSLVPSPTHDNLIPNILPMRPHSMKELYSQGIIVTSTSSRKCSLKIPG